jgi:hypothetical protein
MADFSIDIIEPSTSAMILRVRVDSDESAALHCGFDHPKIPFTLDNSLYY